MEENLDQDDHIKEEVPDKPSDQYSYQDFAERLLSRLLPRLPEGFEKIIDEGLITVLGMNDPVPNAYMKKNGEHCFTIVFNRGLAEFIYRIARALSTRFAVEGDSRNAEQMSFEKTCQIVADIFWWYQETERACGPSYPVTAEQIYLANLLALESESFFLAHELGHVFIEVSDSLDNDTEALSSDPSYIEYKADKFALSVLLQSSTKAYPGVVSPSISYAGAELGLQIFAGLEKIGLDFSRTHPPAMNRLRSLRRNAKSMCADDTSYERLIGLSSNTEKVFSAIIRILETRGSEYESFFRRAADQVVGEMRQILDECTDGFVPDYVRFWNEARRVFDAGYSHKLCEEIAEVTRDFLRSLADLPDERDVPAKLEAQDEEFMAKMMEGQKNFQKYKLLMSFIEKMREPARSIFEKALTQE